MFSSPIEVLLVHFLSFSFSDFPKISFQAKAVGILCFYTIMLFLRPTTPAGPDVLAQITRPRETRCKNKLC